MALKARSDVGRLAVGLIVFFLVVLPFITLYSPNVKALGVVQQNFLSQSCTNCAVAFANNPVLNDFIIVQVSDGSATNLPNSATTDTLGNTFTTLKSDNAQVGVALYVAKQTHTAGADTVTVHYSGVQTETSIGILEVNELGSVTPSVTASGSGTTANPISTGSATPNLDDQCFGSVGSVGTGAAYGEPIPSNPLTINYQSTTNLVATAIGIGLVGLNPSASANTFPLSILKSSSATNTGSAFASLTHWDYVIACLPTTGPTTTTSTTTSTTTTTTFSNTTSTTTTATVTSTTSTTSTSTAYNYIERQNASVFKNSPTKTFLINSTIPVIKNNMLIVTAFNVNPSTNNTFSISDNMSDTWLKKGGGYVSGSNYPDVETFVTNASQSKIIQINITATQNPVRIRAYFHEFNLQDPFLKKSINTTATASFIDVPSFVTNYSNFVYSFAYGQNTSSSSGIGMTTFPASTIKSYNLSSSQSNFVFGSADGYFLGSRTGQEKYSYSANVKAEESVLIFALQANTVTSTTTTSTTSTFSTTTTTTTITPTTTTTTTSTTTTSPTTTTTTSLSTTTTSTTTSTTTTTPTTTTTTNSTTTTTTLTAPTTITTTYVTTTNGTASTVTSTIVQGGGGGGGGGCGPYGCSIQYQGVTYYLTQTVALGLNTSTHPKLPVLGDNYLLLILITFFAVAVAAGCIYVLRHKDEPKQEGRPNWRDRLKRIRDARKQRQKDRKKRYGF